MKINEYGRSMIEMLGVLAIIGVLSVGGIAGYSKAMGKYKTNQVVDQVSMIVTNIRTLYAQQMDYNGLNNLTATNMGVIPEELINKAASTAANGIYSAVSLRNGFQGDVYIGATTSRTSEATSRTAFQVEFQGLSRDACVALSTQDWGSGSASGFIGIAVKGSIQTAANAASSTDVTSLTIGCTGAAGASGALTTACPNGATVRVPLSVTQAATACSCMNNNSCSIVWKYF
ncbi:MAG: hypothetical protein J6Y91_06920 [Alphaproteobacteria bacterium]|nr:hypothetical protein [Alphaproteobacteria bacterium]